MILVTGSSGHIGNVLVRELARIGERVLIMTKSGTKPLWLKEFDIEVCQGDLNDQTSVENAVKKSNIVFHLASKISISSYDTPELRDVNVLGTNFIVEACMKYKVKRLIYTSSIHVLQEVDYEQTKLTKDSFDLKSMHGAYTRTKAEATQIVLNAVKMGLNAVICYPSAVMGPFDFRGSETGRLIKDYATNKLPVYIDGAYNFVDVRDVVDGLILAKDKGRSGEGYILAGEKMTLDQFFDTLSNLEPNMKRPKLKIPLLLALGCARILEGICKIIRTKPFFTSYAIKVLQSDCDFNSQKAVNELGYSYRSLNECIEDSLVWLKNNDKI